MPEQALAQSSGQGIVVPFVIDKDVVISDLASENQRLEQKARDLTSALRLARQVAQSLGDLNRHFASEALGRHATDTEAFLHFMENGGKKAFDQAHPPPG